MEKVLEQVHGKLFRYCDSSTKKRIRLVCQAFGLDIDVFTGLSVIIDDRSEASLDLAKNVKISKLTVENLSPMNTSSSSKDSVWIYSPPEFEFVHQVSLKGQVHLTWILNCLIKFENLTTLVISGLALNARIFNSKIPLCFQVLKSLEISSLGATSNIIEVSESEDYREIIMTAKKMESSLGKVSRVVPVDVESGTVNENTSTPVADNIYHLLYSISSPNLSYFRLTYDEDLYNIGSLNWKYKPMLSFLTKHRETLVHLTLDGEQNDQESFPYSQGQLSDLPSDLQHIFFSMVDTHEYSDQQVAVLPLVKNVIRLRRDQGSDRSLWTNLLKRQSTLESLNCTIYAPWAWAILSKAIEKCSQFLQVINVGCSWLDVESPMNMDLIGECIFLKKFSFSVITPTPDTILDEVVEVRSRCRIENLRSLLTCVFLESILINSALCETRDLEVFTQLPNLTSLVLMYVGKMTGYGVNIGVLQDFLFLRSLNLLIVVEFRRQKHVFESYRLKKILGSEINNQYCPIFQHLAPYSSFGKYVYVGDIIELTLSGLKYDVFQ